MAQINSQTKIIIDPFQEKSKTTRKLNEKIYKNENNFKSQSETIEKLEQCKDCKKSLTVRFSGVKQLAICIKVLVGVAKFRKNLRYFYKKKAADYIYYYPKSDPKPKKLYHRNNFLMNRRDERLKMIKKNQEQDDQDILEEFSLDYFDFNNYNREFDIKDLNIPSNADYSHVGKVTKAGIIHKFKGQTTSFHSRWLVLRGFNLYWYRKADDNKAKGLIPLPNIPIRELTMTDKNKSCFLMEEGISRNLTFLLDFVGQSWRSLLSNQIAYRYYIEYAHNNEKNLSKQIVEYFNEPGATLLNLSNVEFQDAKIYELIYETFNLHNRLSQLILIKSGLNNNSLKSLFKALISDKKCKLEILMLDDNSMNRESMSLINNYLGSEAASELRILTLNKNNFSDAGIQSLLDTLRNRFDKLNQDIKKNEGIILPLSVIGLSAIKMTDQGLFGLISLFDMIHKKASIEGYCSNYDMLSLDISDNLISDNGLKAFSKLFEYFHGIRELNLSNSESLNGKSFQILMTQLKSNYSLQTLYYQNNVIDEECINLLLRTLEENFVIKKVALTCKKIHYGILISKYEMVMKYFQL